VVGARRLSRQVGGRAAGGRRHRWPRPRETKIELDRRRISSRMAKLRHELKGMKTARADQAVPSGMLATSPASCSPVTPTRASHRC
jgi:hypothetical protein